MKKLSRLSLLSAIGGITFVASASIGFLSLDDKKHSLVAMSEQEMSSVRGGFISINDTIINIGLTISTALNGSKVYTSQIANLTIDNGVLTSVESAEVEDPIKIVQNEAPGTGENTVNPGLTFQEGSIANIIQNTVDGANIKIQTELNIEADVEGFLKQQGNINRLENAILSHSY
ncbi:hypothetical protein A3K86_15365 [Photobacterium jeanii]|uniref:Uncharacterized protein n=1 Tax=Photobacterium jeanii TaxID=858640 RepID=A0A178K8Q3_9GAMM|nr:hypothetical protein [Photobacterium jeanii]OAN13043.1 hypothetical protein A3K86_15365 [Photobacterium jeanii]PST89191.1 hypothetical protein C9I91_13810 [Photobacterium jeanii]